MLDENLSRISIHLFFTHSTKTLPYLLKKSLKPKIEFFQSICFYIMNIDMIIMNNMNGIFIVINLA